MFTDLVLKGITLGTKHRISSMLVLLVHPVVFQGLYLSEVVADSLQSCKLPCRASYTIMQKATSNCSHATMNVRVPKYSLHTST